ncbi:MAG: tuaH [Candidatus Midichloriaceae bacterium]|jgi:hypothetical protein|nr:tuaH [Candidatus Midichloriaceae bacterium]
MERKLKIAFLYVVYSSEIIASTYYDHIEAFGKHSRHTIDYIPIFPRFNENQGVNLSCYDCLVLHYGATLYNSTIALLQGLIKEIKAFPGLKVYFAQDEYTTPAFAVSRIKEMGIHHIFSCANSEETFRAIYSKSKLPNLTFSTVLTGYIPDNMYKSTFPSLEERPLDIVYRGNTLGIAWGALGAEKFQIGMKMKKVLQDHKFTYDIEWKSDKKIYGSDWVNFLKSGRTTLCTESGASLIHHDIKTRDILLPTIDIAKACDTYEEFEHKTSSFAKHLINDGKHTISCIPPKAFEAIACGTVLVCYEGWYSGAIKPDVHYIPLKKDWSNIEDVLSKIKDISYLEQIQKTAYNDIILSGKYSYSAFIKAFDDRIAQLFATHNFIESKQYLVPYTKVLKDLPKFLEFPPIPLPLPDTKYMLFKKSVKRYFPILFFIIKYRVQATKGSLKYLRLVIVKAYMLLKNSVRKFSPTTFFIIKYCVQATKGSLKYLRLVLGILIGLKAIIRR